MFSIVDIETTGLSPKTGKITEIAIYVFDGEKIVDEFSTLLNPEMDIPYRITQLTGINNKMVKDAPRFCDVARQIVEMTENTTLVGHNVNFDYNFIRSEFNEFGYDYRRKLLCTARLSRRLIPGRRSYSLGKLCQELSIDNPHRHRAYGDAAATFKLFEMLLRVKENVLDNTLKGLNTSLSTGKLKALPEEPGVYYFYDSNGNIIYIGKSKNIHDRVLSHLSNNGSKRAVEMREQISDVGFELTGNELIALLLESAEIKKYTPRFNHALRRSNLQWGLFCREDEKGYMRMKISKNMDGERPLNSFSSALAAKNHLFMLTEAFGLCQKLCGLYDSKGACFQFHTRQCKGACISAEPPEAYNLRVMQAIAPYMDDRDSFFIVGKGRTITENCVVAVENGKFLGFGFIESDMTTIQHPNDMVDYITPMSDHRDARQIIKSYLKKNNDCRVIEWGKELLLS